MPSNDDKQRVTDQFEQHLDDLRARIIDEHDDAAFRAAAVDASALFDELDPYGNRAARDNGYIWPRTVQPSVHGYDSDIRISWADPDDVFAHLRDW